MSEPKNWQIMLTELEFDIANLKNPEYVPEEVVEKEEEMLDELDNFPYLCLHS